MKKKTFEFNPEWLEPLEEIESDSRWRILAATVAYAMTNQEPEDLDATEAVSFRYIRADIDRMRARANEISERRRAAGIARQAKRRMEIEQNAANVSTREEETEKRKETETPLPHTPTLKEKENKKEKEEEKSSTATRAKNYPEWKLLERFFGDRNQIRLEAMAMQMRIGLPEMKRMAEAITDEWTLTGKTHDDYGDASRHLISSLRKKASWERQERQRQVAAGVAGTSQKGVLGIGEWIDQEGRRTYNGRTFVPNDATPRPTKGHYWNYTTKGWENIP